MTNIDIPDFEDALKNDRDGSFHKAVQAYLDESMHAVRSQMKQGLAPIDFENAGKIEAAIEKAAHVIRFSDSTISR